MANCGIFQHVASFEEVKMIRTNCETVGCLLPLDLRLSKGHGSMFPALVLLLLSGCHRESNCPRIDTQPDRLQRNSTAPGSGRSDISILADFVNRAEYVGRGDGPWEGRITSPSHHIVSLLEQLRASGQSYHLPILVKYGLKHHLLNLQHTGIGRKLDVSNNFMLAEVVRLLNIPRYQSAHEAGWLDSQFDGAFEDSGWSSYQIYVQIKERGAAPFDESASAPAIASLMGQIRTSGRADIGGFGVCHYGCH